MRKKKRKLIRQKLNELYKRLDNKTFSEKDKAVMFDMLDVSRDLYKASENNDEEALEKIRQRLKKNDPLNKLIENDEERETKKD